MKIEVVEIKTDKVVDTVEIKNESQVDKTERGMLINMDRDRFFTRVV